MIHKIQVRPRSGAENTITTGANTELYLDGKLLKGARFIKFEVDARKVSKVTIELYAQVELDAVADLELVETKKFSKTLELQTLKSKNKSI